MSSEGPRTGPVRDVPRPRPVEGEVVPGPESGGGLGRAARSLADAVAGLLGDRDAPASGPSTAGPAAGSRAARTLRDVVGAVASAVRGGGDDGAPAATAGAGEAGGRSWNPGTVLTDLLRTAAPRLPIRDRDRIRAAHPGRTDSEIAEHLVSRAATLTAGIGAATGGLTAAQWFAPPSMVALPLELGAETVLVAAVEVVLIGELHELHGRPAVGEAGQRAGAYLNAWTSQRAVDGVPGQGGLLSTIGSAGVNALRRRVTRRLARNVSSAAPFLLGATLAARSNRKATTELAEKVLADLRTALPGSS
ncbi:hypothetical protein [Modestobacter sp. Leaf380]|uniref:hypothetical protein n=1 Tax=Modestobacter sp. Leaf380 TaxID=1736356 RepID=UPI0006FBF78A|nr:hypothetical protein [Modestobacter sp. Leaf380]KQS63637.1 hypothetical protein ASG41_18515 [Modestobacter sp. Leaf380]